jgi:predicted glycoside hydrolase/deacetylase ChbG (UPF0249 family)
MTRDLVPVVLCADDFAIAPGVSRAICELVRAGRLTATSCMAVSPFLGEHAGWLTPYREHVDIGLHLTLTDMMALAPMPRLAPERRLPPLKVLMKKAITGRVDGVEIRGEIERQFDAFERAFGRSPDFVDGHHHVHQLPVIRREAIEVASRRCAGPRYFRSCSDTPVSIWLRSIAAPKAAFIGMLGAGLRHRASKHGLRTNPSFSGIYEFNSGSSYAMLFERFLVRQRSDGIIMCHPGFVDEDLREVDAVTSQREREFAFFSGPELQACLDAAGYRLARFGCAVPDR